MHAGGLFFLDGIGLWSAPRRLRFSGTTSVSLLVHADVPQVPSLSPRCAVPHEIASQPTHLLRFRDRPSQSCSPTRRRHHQLCLDFP